jgi:hypothetical protein
MYFNVADYAIFTDSTVIISPEFFYTNHFMLFRKKETMELFE